MYVDEKMSMHEIMRATGATSTNAVTYWMKTYGIKARTLSEAVTVNWQQRRLRAVP